MQRDEAVSKMRENVEAVKALGATALFVFGSTARDEADAESDLDVFVDYDPAKKFSLFDLAGIKVLLEEKLGIEVDVTTRDSLHPLLRKRIERSAIRIF
jgi:predicted nucleotidyltransferase